MAHPVFNINEFLLKLFMTLSQVQRMTHTITRMLVLKVNVMRDGQILRSRLVECFNKIARLRKSFSTLDFITIKFP